MSRHVLWMALFIAGALILVWPFDLSSAPATNLEPSRITLDADDLATAQHERTRITPEGITTDHPMAQLITVPQAVDPFTDILVAWEASHAHDLALFVRTSADARAWTDWAPLIAHEDFHAEGDAPELHWGAPLYAGDAAWWQIKVQFSSDHHAPVLKSLQVDTVHVGSLEPVTPQHYRQAALNTVAKPPVVSRSQWGSEDGQGSRVPPAYYPTSHMVVHHTVDPNYLTGNEGWWGDRVRAIWSFHTYSRGWGDIGYNYLVAPDGTIFEGRAGGDNAVGFHDTGNYGSMGVAMIGTYASSQPSPTAQDSVVELLAWKAAQRGIDPLGASYYYGCDISRYCSNSGATTPNISGHRNVANNPSGYTSCPGDSLYDILPTLRARVQSRLGGYSDNGDLTIDNLESSFIRSTAQWYEERCGDGGHVFYTFATDDPADSTNSGRWRKTGLETGDYRIYVHIPQNCPFTNRTNQARYTIWQNGVQLGDAVVNQDTTIEWIEITNGPLALTDQPVEVHLTDYTGEPLSAGKVVVYDTVRWVREVPQTAISLENVVYDRTTVASGELLKVTFTVRNTGNTVIQTQLPHPGDPADPLRGYTYDEGECFAGNSVESYPAYPKESGRLRVMLGSNDITLDCVAQTGGYPWRWGLGSELAPGETRTVIGYVRFRNHATENRTVTLRAGLIQEYVSYMAQDTAQQSITITPERDNPQSNSYTEAWQPEAFVYELGAIPDDFLARTANPLSIPEGTFLGSIAWDGQYRNWGATGPFNRPDAFIVRQTRTFHAPVDGVYSFRITSDDGAWLWIDGSLMVEAHGLHPEREATGERWLAAGNHVLSFKYFERSAQAAMHYDWQPPGSTTWSTIPVEVGGNGRYANGYFGPNSRFTITADDHGGVGVDRIRWRLDDQAWTETPGNTMSLNASAGVFNLQYQALDRAGNSEDIRTMSWQIDGQAPTSHIPDSHLAPSGMIVLNISATDQQSGLATIAIEVRDVTIDGQWKHWQTIEQPETVNFFGLNNHTYQFRTQATDAVGNQEAEHLLGDVTHTVPATTALRRVYLPAMRR